MSTGRKVIPLFPAQPPDRLAEIEASADRTSRRAGNMVKDLRRIKAGYAPEYNAELPDPIAEVTRHCDEREARRQRYAAPVEMAANVVPLFSPARQDAIEWHMRIARMGRNAKKAETFLAACERRDAALANASVDVDAIRERQNVLPAAIEHIQRHSDNAGRHIAPVLARIESAREGHS